MNTKTNLIAKFRDLSVGQTFDFVSGTSRDSFFERCVKISARCYCTVDYTRRATRYKVGTINATVYHVGQNANN